MKIINIDQLLKELDKYTFQQFHIHHTWKPEKKDFNGNNHMRLQESMKNYHMRTNGWSDIAQHISLFPDGLFVTGRPFNIQPASIKGWNHKKPLMVEMIGNFDKGHDKLEGEQLKSLLKIIKYFIEKYGQQSIIFHRDNSPKTCPGTSLDKLELIRQAIVLDKKEKPLKEVYKVEKIKLDIHNKKKEVEGIVQDGINYVPVRLLEDLGYKVSWSQANKTVKVEYNDK